MVLGLWDLLFCVQTVGSMGLVRRLAVAISRLLETNFPTFFHAASALSAPSGHLPLEGKAIYIKRRGHHLSYFSCKRGFHSQPALVNKNWTRN